MPAKKVQETSAGPWKSFRGSRHARVGNFIETQCRAASAPGRPLIKLADFQWEWLEATFAPGVTTSIESIPKGNGKSTFKAGIGLWNIFDGDDDGDPQVPVIATKVQQAMKTIYTPACRMVELNPELERRCIIKTSITDPQIYVPATAGSMFPFADGVDGLQGLNPTLAMIDEIGFMSQESWAAVSAAVGKGGRTNTRILAIGTPGFDLENALWLNRANFYNGQLPPEILFKEYAATAGCPLDDEVEWARSNPAFVAGFKGRVAFTSGIANLTEGQFRIYHLGQWVQGFSCWLGTDAIRVWGALADPSYRLVPGAPTWAAVDAAKTRDNAAVVLVQRRPDGRLHAVAKIWKPTDFANKTIDTAEIARYIKEASEKYQLVACGFDPRFFDTRAEALESEKIPMIEFPQSPQRMVPAVGETYEMIKKGLITHDGDALFQSHIMNAVPHYVSETGFTLKKKSPESPDKIDAAAALCMAVRMTHVPVKKKAPLAIGSVV